MIKKNNDRIASYRLLAFAAPSFVTSFIYGPMSGVLPALIVKNFGVEMAAMSGILLISRIFDGITDPVIGILSDRTISPIGRRKPWIIAGALLLMIAAYKIFLPAQNADSTYFLIWLLIITLGWTVMELPYTAWLSEITRDYNERTRIQAFRQAAVQCGAIFFALAPLLPMFTSNEMTFEVLGLVGKVTLLILPLAVFMALVLNSEGERLAVHEALSIKDLVRSVKANKPFQLFLLIFIFNGLSLGMIATLSFPVLDSYLKIGDKFSYIMVCSPLCCFLSLPMWIKIGARIGKHKALVVSGMVIIIMHSFFLLIKPGPGSFIPYLILTAASSVVYGANLVIPAPMLADIIDYDLLKTGTNRAGQYSSVLTMLYKLNGAIAAAFGYFLLDLFGFNFSSHVHSETAVTGLKLTYVFIPLSFAFISTCLCWFFPIDERRQKIIRKRIEMRARRQKVVR